MVYQSTSFFVAVLQERCILSGHVPAQETAQTEQIQEAQHNLSGKHSPQISGDAEYWDSLKYEEQAKQQRNYIHGEDSSGLAQSLQNAGEGGVQLEERAQEAPCGDEMSGQRTVKESTAHKAP